MAIASRTGSTKASRVPEAIRNAISIGGDSDTLAVITGSIAEERTGEGLAETYQRFASLISPIGCAD